MITRFVVIRPPWVSGFARILHGWVASSLGVSARSKGESVPASGLLRQEMQAVGLTVTTASTIANETGSAAGGS